MSPQYEGEEVKNPFDLWNGMNFKLKVKTVADFANYDDSSFDSSSTKLLPDDAKMEKIWKSQYSLKEITSPDKFKTYEELSERLAKSLRTNKPSISANNMPNKPSKVSQVEQAPFESNSESGEDDGMDFFKKLTQESDE